MTIERSGSDPATGISRVAVVRLSAIGDVVLMLPTIHCLLDGLPETEVTWIVGRGAAPILQGLAVHPRLKIKIIDKPGSLADYWRLRKTLGDRAFDVVLATQASLRTNLIYPLLKAPRKIGFDHHRAKDRQAWFVTEQIPFAEDHLADSFLAFARQIGVATNSVKWGLSATEQALEAVRTMLPKADYVVINPAASKPERNWPAARYARVVEHLASKNVPVVITGGNSEVEQALSKQVVQHCSAQVTDLTGRTSLSELVAVLAGARALVAPDTGPIHIANALNVPVIGLYAVAPSKLSGPYGQQHLVVDKYSEAVATLLDRDPSTVPWGTRVHDARAMNLISTEEVIARLESQELV